MDLYFYMQGNRYVLWNFQNIFPHPKTGRCTGTVEFRGGNQFLNTRGTLAWVAFVLGFITLALQEVSFTMYECGIDDSEDTDTALGPYTPRAKGLCSAR